METIETKVNLPSSFLTATKVKETELDVFIRRSLLWNSTEKVNYPSEKQRKLLAYEINGGC